MRGGGADGSAAGGPLNGGPASRAILNAMCAAAGKADLDAPRLATWTYAGLMVTYWCNAKCAFCYVYSGPDRGGELPVERALEMWRGLDRIAARAGKRMRIHLAGGEPFGNWPHLLAIVRAAGAAGLSRLEKIETNGYWAVSDGLTRARLEQLDALGIEHLLVSADVYHQEFIPLERVARLVRIARQVLGPARVKVRWWERLQSHAGPPTGQPRHSPGRNCAEGQAALFERALQRHEDRLTGRAADRLSIFYERHPAQHFAEEHCAREILGSQHVHVDPHGNVFPGVCAGIVFGNTSQEQIEDLWVRVGREWRTNPVLRAVVGGGSHALMRAAEQLGYRPLPEGYANKCHLCTHVRQYLVERGGWEEWLGPRECYANGQDQREAAEWNRAVSLTINGKLRRRSQPAAVFT